MKQGQNKKVDYLIIGQGIAGTILAHFLIGAGQSIHIIDDANPNSSTAVAAGLINPVTGRHFIKSWRIEEFLPVAVETYKALEEKFNIKLYHCHNIIRAIFNAGEQNEWLARSASPDYDRFVVDEADEKEFNGKITPVYDFIEIGEGAKVDVGVLINTYRDFFKAQGYYTQSNFDYKLLNIKDEAVVYEGIQARKVIFCEGAKVKENPYFNYLPFLGDKGEVLIVRIPGSGFEKILKHKLYIIPTREKDIYWVGATMQRDFKDSGPTESGRQYLLSQLQKILTIPFEILDHQAAVRPTVRDRRPFIGSHPKLKPLYLFNGMGSKGTSLAPFWAQQTVLHLFGKNELDKEVNIKKYERYFG